MEARELEREQRVRDTIACRSPRIYDGCITCMPIIQSWGWRQDVPRPPHSKHHKHARVLMVLMFRNELVFPTRKSIQSGLRRYLRHVPERHSGKGIAFEGSMAKDNSSIILSRHQTKAGPDYHTASVQFQWYFGGVSWRVSCQEPAAGGKKSRQLMSTRRTVDNCQ